MTIFRGLFAALFFLFLPELQGAGVPPGEHRGPWLMGVSSLTGPAHAIAQSRSAWPGPFPVEVLRVRDGDTLDVRFRDGPCGRAPCPRQELALRLRGVDAPEIHFCASGVSRPSCAACKAEQNAGLRAKAATVDFVRGGALRVRDLRQDKYGGRIVGDLQAFRDGRWVSLSSHLIKSNLAVAYDGGRKSKPWCRAGSR